MRSTIKLIAGVTLSVFAVGILPAAAASYPDHPVKIVVPFAPAGPTDVMARLIAQKLSDSLKQQFYIENHPGAGGNIGMTQVAKSPPDGYTILVASSSYVVNPSLYAKNPYDPFKDFAPVTLAAASPNILVVHEDFPATSVKELVDLIKKNPGKYNYAMPGTGTTPHLAGELFKLTFHLDLTTVPFNGTAQLVTSAIAGDTPIVFTSLPSAMPIVREGKLRALVVLSKNRVESLPDVPGTTESGIEGLEGDTVSGLVAPAGTPRPIIDKLNAEIKKAAATADMKEKLAVLGFGAVASLPDEFGDRIKAEIVKWAKVIRDSNIKVD